MRNERIKTIVFLILSIAYALFFVIKYYPIAMAGIALGGASSGYIVVIKAIAVWYIWGLLMILPLMLLHLLLFRNFKKTTGFLLGFPMIFVVLAIVITLLLPVIYPSPSDVTQNTSKKIKYRESERLKSLMSSQYKFSFQYPESWNFKEDWERTIAVAHKFVVRPQLEGLEAQIEIYIRNNSEYLGNNFETQPLERTEELSEINSRNEFTTVSGLRGIKFIGTPASNFIRTWNLGEGQHRMVIVQFRGNEYTYVIIAVYPAENKYTSNFEEELNTLVTSFALL